MIFFLLNHFLLQHFAKDCQLSLYFFSWLFQLETSHINSDWTLVGLSKFLTLSFNELHMHAYVNKGYILDLRIFLIEYKTNEDDSNYRLSLKIFCLFIYLIHFFSLISLKKKLMDGQWLLFMASQALTKNQQLMDHGLWADTPKWPFCSCLFYFPFFFFNQKYFV